MKFEMDFQTYRDLNILTETNTSGSIFNIFKYTKTMGGREKLRDMMTSPSSDIAFVSARKEAIKYFSSQKIELDITNHQLDLIEHYLKYNKGHLRTNIIDATVGFIHNKVSPQIDYYIIKVGVENLIKLLRYLLALARDMPLAGVPELVIRHSARIISLLEKDTLARLVSLDERKLNFYHISKLDRLLRGKEADVLRELLDITYELDVYETVALAAQTKGFCFPEYVEDKNVKLAYTGLFHPNITSPVKNDVSLSEDSNIVFLTGSNMAGKSSLLKSLGLAVYLAHIGFPVPATKLETTVFSGLVTTINLPDDINSGLSHYYSEVKRVKHVASILAQNENMFIIFDELFRGTNVKDAYDASLLIISELAAVYNSLFFISTHIVELAEELKKFSNVSFRYMDVVFEDKKPVFTYKLKDGISKERLGMYIVQNEGIIELIKKAAEKKKK